MVIFWLCDVCWLTPQHWNSLPEVVDASSLEMFKVRLDDPVEGVPAHGRRDGLDDLWGFFLTQTILWFSDFLL